MGNHSSNLLRDAVFGSSLSPTSSSRDERIQVSEPSSPPYCWTCQLLIESKRGNKYTANGVKINISPSTGSQVILTSGHSIFTDGAYAKKITVRFPVSNHKESFVVSEKQMWASPQYIKTSRPMFDYGFILLPGESNEGFGWTTLLSNEEMMGRPLTTCGYPADDPNSNLWITGGGVEKISQEHIHYMQDSLGTGSGSPVYTWYKGYWTIVGIQCFGGVFNTAVRLNAGMMHEIMRELKHTTSYTIQPQTLTNLYLTKTTSSSAESTSSTQSSLQAGAGGGGVLCKTTGELFDVFPLQIQQGTNADTIRRDPIIVKGLSLYTDASFEDSNNKSASPAPLPVFSVKNEFTDPVVGNLHNYYFIHAHKDEGNGETVSFESVTAEGIYLSTDKSGVIKHINIHRDSKPGPYERFFLQPVKLQK